MSTADRLGLTMNRVGALLALGQEEGWTEAARLPRDAPTPEERQQIARGNLNIGDLAMRWGRHAEAARRLAWALNLAETHGYVRIRDMTLVTRAHLDWFTGAWDGLAERAGSLADNNDIQPVTRLEAVIVIGLLHAAAGDGAVAAEHLRRVLTGIRGSGAVESTAVPAAALARLALADGRVDEALQVTEEPIGIVSRKGTWVWAADLAPARVAALAAAGRGAEADQLVTAFARHLRGRDAPAPKAAVIVCRALIAQARGQQARAVTTFARAAAAWRALPRPYDALLAREQQAHCLLACSGQEAGLLLLRDVLRDLSQLGAAGDAARVARTLRENGLRIRRPGAGRPSYGDQLSPRELEVVRLLASGHTSREIARKLFLSPKTVSRHLDSAMRKLNVSSRAALAARALQAGVIPGGSGEESAGFRDP